MRHLKANISTFIIFCWFSLANAGEARIAAASSLTFALNQIADQFQQATGHQLKISYASSGALTRQIRQGAPFELFLSADDVFSKILYQENLAPDQGTAYSKGRLVLFVPQQSALKPDADLSSLITALEAKQLRHLSIPNPQFAPYGQQAEKALKNAGIYDRIRPALILGENASQSARFVTTGAVDAALLPLSIAIIMKQQDQGEYVVLSTTLCPSLEHHMVLLNHAGVVAQAFYDFMLTDKAQQILNQHGFDTDY